MYNKVKMNQKHKQFFSQLYFHNYFSLKNALYLNMCALISRFHNT